METPIGQRVQHTESQPEGCLEDTIQMYMSFRRNAEKSRIQMDISFKRNAKGHTEQQKSSLAQEKYDLVNKLTDFRGRSAPSKVAFEEVAFEKRGASHACTQSNLFRESR